MNSDPRQTLPMTTNNKSLSRANADFYPEELLDDSRGLDLKEFLNVISRYKKLIIGIALLTMLLALLLTLLMKPVYRAHATIKVERYAANPSVQILNPETSRSDRDFFETQVQLLQTKTLANRVIIGLDLNKKQDTTGFVYNLKKLFKAESTQPTTQSLSDTEEIFLKNLTVTPINNSQLLSISYDSTSPKLASDVANSIANTFLEQNLERRFEAASSYKKYVSESIEVTKKSLDDAESRLNEYAKTNNIVQDVDGQSASSFKLKKQAEELLVAEKERIEAESAYSSYLNNPDNTPASINNDPYIQSLKKAAARLETQYQSFKNRTTRTPKRLRKQIDEVLKQIDAETETLKSSLRNRLLEAQQKEKILRSQLGKLREGALNVQSKNTSYERLLREVEINQIAYNQQLEQMMAVNIASNVSTNNISIIDAASTPTKKFKPSLKTNLAFGLILGSLLGLGFAFIREFMDDSVKTTKLLEKTTGLTVLAQLPNIKKLGPKKLALQTAIEPHSTLAESIKSLRTSLRFSTQNGAPKTTFITSSVAGEGKSTLALNLATAYAQVNQKVLLIDADLRSPSMHYLLELNGNGKNSKDAKPGLTHYLSSSELVNSEVIQNCKIQGLDVITSGPIPPDPVELLSGSRMIELIESNANIYDHIIIDGPPVLGLADALVLANLAEATIITVQAGRTKKSALLDSLKRLERANANMLGTVLTRVGPENNPDYNLEYYTYSNNKNS
ncbi:MAG: succinoglycan biosynthesis transport protein ExoP [Cocleimonas sp.]|jgi:succinoglycan biosynthesis transport protein ExoP